MPNLLMHQADAYVPRFKVENTPTPPPTQSWRPIPHTRLLETVEANLKDKGFLITSQSHGLTHNHNRYFGLLEIRSPDGVEDYQSIIGVRNSHDKMTSSPKLVPAAVRESFRAAGPERILSDESETTLSGSDHSEVASC